MTRDERKQMKSYITPKPHDFGPSNKGGHRDFVMRVSMLWPCMAKIGPDAKEDIVEDTIMEVYAMCISNDKWYGPIAFMRTVRTYYMRKIYKERGLTARGTVPKMLRFYIGNVYDDNDGSCLEDFTDPESLKEILDERRRE